MIASAFAALMPAAVAQTTQIIGPSGDGTNSLNQPRHCFVDDSGVLYVTGDLSDNAFRIATDGTITEILDPSGGGTGVPVYNARGVVVDGSGNVFVAGFDSDAVFKIPTSGPTRVVISATGDGTNILDGPDGLAIDGTSLYVTGARSDNVFKVDVSGDCHIGGTPCTITEIMDATGDGTNILDVPTAIGVDGTGDVIVLGDGSDNAFRIDTPGSCSTGGTPCTITEIFDNTAGGLANIERPYALFIGAGDEIYLSAALAGDSTVEYVFSITPAGVISRELNAYSEFGLGIHGIAVDDSDHLLISLYYMDAAIVMYPDRTTWQFVLDASGDGIHSLLASECLVLDGTNNLFVSGLLSDNVFKLVNRGLPVELYSFEAFLADGTARLAWATDSELQNAGFYVQHREKTFTTSSGIIRLDASSHWSDLGFVEGSGTSALPHYYEFRTASLDAGTHVFRLKQVDLDGTIALSPEIEVVVEAQFGFQLKALYPNPAGTFTTAEMVLSSEQDIDVSLFDVTGRLVRRIHHSAMPAHLRAKIEIDASGLPAGLYLVRIDGREHSETKKLTVVR